MIVKRAELYLVQDGFQILVPREANKTRRRRNVRITIAKVGATQPVTGAERPLVTQQLMARDRQRAFAEVEVLARLRRGKRRRRIWPHRDLKIHGADFALCFRGKDFSRHGDESAGPELLFEGQIPAIKSGRGVQSADGFGDEAAEGLIETGHL